MTTGSSDAYCAYTKAVEHLGDRWCLQILADLTLSGPRGFNALANGLPGRISRSTLAERLRRLEGVGVIAKTGGRRSTDAYRLTTIGQSLVPTIMSLIDWARTWLPDDPYAVERDPDIALGWLARRVDPTRLPERRTVVEIRMRHQRVHRLWLVLECGSAPYGCLQDPLLDESRYVYLEAALPVLLALARGTYSWSDALADGSLVAYGDPHLTRQVPSWFHSSGRSLAETDKGSSGG